MADSCPCCATQFISSFSVCFKRNSKCILINLGEEAKSVLQSIIFDTLQITKSLPKSCRLENSRVSQYLSLMVDDQDKFVKKIGESGGGTYVIGILDVINY